MYYVGKLAVPTRSVPGARPALLRERRAPRHVQSRGKPLRIPLPREHVGDFFVFLARIREPRPGARPPGHAPIGLRDDVGFRFVEEGETREVSRERVVERVAVI